MGWGFEEWILFSWIAVVIILIAIGVYLCHGDPHCLNELADAIK